MDWFKIITLLFPAIEQAIKAIMEAKPGKTQAQAMTDFVDHITPGQPNSSALSG